MNSKFLKMYNLIMENIVKQSKSPIATFENTKIQNINDFKNIIDSDQFKNYTKISKQIKRGIKVNVKTTIIGELLDQILTENPNIKVLNRNDIININLPDGKIVELRGSVGGYSRVGSPKLRTDVYQTIIALSVNKLKNGEDILFKNEQNVEEDLQYVQNNISIELSNENILNTLEYYKNTIIKAPYIIFEKFNNDLFCYHTKFKNTLNIKILETGNFFGVQKDKINPGDIWLVDLNSIDEINQLYDNCQDLDSIVNLFNTLLKNQKLIGISLKQFSGDGKLDSIPSSEIQNETSTSFDPQKFIGAVCDLTNKTGNNYVYFNFEGIKDGFYGIQGRVGGNATGNQAITLQGKEGGQRHGKARSLLTSLLGIKNSSVFMKFPLNQIMDVSGIDKIKNDIKCDNSQLNYLISGQGQIPYSSRINQRQGRDRALISILLYCYNVGGQQNYKKQLLRFASKTLTIPIKGQKQETASYIIVH